MSENKHEYKTIHEKGELDSLVRPGEGMVHVCSIHRESFMKTMATMDMLIPTLAELTRKEKSFRVEMYYDAEADNFEMLTFVRNHEDDSDGE